MRLRIRCHLHYGKECDDACHPSMRLKGLTNPPQNIFVLTDADINQIIEIYLVIFPLSRVFKQFCQTRNFAELSKESFYDNGLLVQGEAYEKLHQYSQAKNCYHQALAVNPDDAKALFGLASLLWRLAEHKQAREYIHKAYALGTRKNYQWLISEALNLQGLICKVMGDSKKAIDYCEEALGIDKKFGGKEHHGVAIRLSNLGIAWNDLGNAKKAIIHY